MKSLTIAGNIGKDAELRSTGKGEQVAGFSVGVTDGFGDNKRTLWFDVSIWGKRAETLAPMLTKGGKVCVSGDLSTREYDGKTYLTLRASEVTLMGGKPDGERGESFTKQEFQQVIGKEVRDMRRDAMDDEIPF